jgi:hypothetical protein
VVIFALQLKISQWLIWVLLFSPCTCFVTNSCALPFRYPEILQLLEMSISEINATVVPPSNLAWDSRADPYFWDHTWTNFGDYSILNNAVS